MNSEQGLNQNDMKEIIADFLAEADELVASLDGNFVKLEAAPEDLDLLNEIFRAAHTIKGTSSFLGFEQVTTLTHRMEDILNKLRKGEMHLTPGVMDLLLRGLDTLKTLLEKVRGGKVGEEDIAAILGDLASVVNDTDFESRRDGMTPGNRLGGRGVDLAAGRGPAQAGRKALGEQTIRVDVERLNSLLDMVGELVLGRNSLVQSVAKLNADHDGEAGLAQLTQAMSAVNFITTELQMAVMKMRMQPLSKVFGRFPRMVRDLARETGKQIELEIAGETTEVDKSVIEEIADPLLHIIRNSCDHGIEPPSERQAKGKPAAGLIRLEASREGSNIVVKVRDDGRGFDAAAIRAKAVERGLIDSADAERLSDREAFKFIFEAGFSTARTVSGVSGRGVGMDVVRTNIEKLNGMVQLDSERDRGAAVTIKLPLTLAIIRGLLVRCEDDVYILPLSSVIETVKTVQSDIHYVNRRPVLCLRDEIIPIVNLSRVLRREADSFTLTEMPYIVVVGLAERKLGLIVDRLLGQEEVVIKSLGSYLGPTEGVAGATILGDGRIRLIVDMVGLFSVCGRVS